MTVDTDVAEWTFNFTGAETSYAMNPGYFAANSDIQIALRPASGADSTLTEGVHYSLTGAGVQNGGVITVISFPLSAGTVIVERVVAITQETDRAESIAYPESVTEADFDKIVMIAQQLNRKILRALRHPAGETAGALPGKAAMASRLLAFDASGDPEAGPLTSTVTDLATAVDDAEAAEAAAAASAVAAAASATAAAAEAQDVSALVQNIPNMATATGDGATATVTLPAEPVDEKALLVSLDGIFQHTDAFSVSGTTLTFSAAPPNGVAIEVRDLSSTAIVNATDVSALAAIAAAISTVAGISADVSTVAANDSDISDVADDLNGSNTIGAAITAASNAASSATAAAGSATAAAASATAAATAETNAETAETNAETAQAAAETAQTAAETAQTAAETAETNAETAETNAAASETAAAASASSAASAVADAIIAAARAGFRQRFALMPPSIFGFDLGEVSQIALTRATVGFTNLIDGSIQSKAIDALRLTHDPETGEPLGLLVEPQRTNRVKTHNNIAVNTFLRLTRVQNDVVAPDGTTTADRLTETTDTGTHQWGGSLNVTDTFTGGEIVVASVWVKSTGSVVRHIALKGGQALAAEAPANTNDHLGFVFDPTAETIRTYWDNVSSGIVVGFEKYANGWYRCWAAGPVKAAGGTGGLVVEVREDDTTTSYTGDTNAEVSYWGAQVEVVTGTNSRPTSLVKTAGAAATRSADLATVDLSAVSAFRPDGFSVLIEGEIHDTNGTFLSIGKTATQEVALDMQSGALHVTSSSGLDLTAASGLSAGDRIVVALRMAEDDVAVAVDGAAVVTDISHTLYGDADEMQLGANIAGASGLPCAIQQIAIFGPLPDATLEAMSNG